MDPRVNSKRKTPPKTPMSGEPAELLRVIEREIAADLRAVCEPSVWDEIATVFDEGA